MRSRAVLAKTETQQGLAGCHSCSCPVTKAANPAHTPVPNGQLWRSQPLPETAVPGPLGKDAHLLGRCECVHGLGCSSIVENKETPVGQ